MILSMEVLRAMSPCHFPDFLLPRALPCQSSQVRAFLFNQQIYHRHRSRQNAAYSATVSVEWAGHWVFIACRFIAFRIYNDLNLLEAYQWRMWLKVDYCNISFVWCLWLPFPFRFHLYMGRDNNHTKNKCIWLESVNWMMMVNWKELLKLANLILPVSKSFHLIVTSSVPSSVIEQTDEWKGGVRLSA